MQFIWVGCLTLAYVTSLAYGTCVLDSDFGFILNCNFKKSSLFRVRNLGGVKAHFGLGFSLGDELGFGESLGNVEGNKRRSLSDRDSSSVNSIGVLPASKLPPTQPQLQVQQNRPHAVTVRQPQQLMQQPQQMIQQQQQLAHQKLQQQQQLQHQPRAATVTMPNRPQQQIYKKSSAIAMTEAVSLPLGVPAFRRIPALAEDRSSIANYVDPQAQNSFNRKVMYQHPVLSQLNNLTYAHAQPFRAAGTSSSVVQKIPKHNMAVMRPMAAIAPGVSASSVNAIEVPAFQAMPSSVSRIVTGQIVQLDGNNEVMNKEKYQSKTVKREDVRSHPSRMASASKDLPEVDLRGHTVEELALVANVSVETIQNAIKMRQQQLVLEQQTNQYHHQLDMLKAAATRLSPTRAPTRPPITTTTITTTTTTTTTPLPPTTPKYVMAGGSKVMNAPKEYYPVGYDKNFDDNFMSKVDLPPTTFHCGDQKHFPGLYADTDLGCMVFHVCALTDDGLIMKSFLCPESTLFDQTVLKCNWWFYVDCKGSKSLYDSNLPVSKSYQLMKALTFFSNYKNNQNEKDGVDVEALKNSVALNNQMP